MSTSEPEQTVDSAESRTAPTTAGETSGGVVYSAPSTEYFPVRRNREWLAEYLSAHGREDEAYQRDEE